MLMNYLKSPSNTFKNLGTLEKWISWSKLSTTTKNSIIKLTKGITKFAYINYDIQDNAKELHPIVEPLEELKEKRFMNYDEFKRFIYEIDNLVYKTFFEFCYFTGVRRTETLTI